MDGAVGAARRRGLDRRLNGNGYHVPLLPALQFFGRFLLQGLQELGDEDVGWLVHQEVDVFGHQDVGVDAGTVVGSGLLELVFDDGLGVRV